MPKCTKYFKPNHQLQGHSGNTEARKTLEMHGPVWPHPSSWEEVNIENRWLTSTHWKCRFLMRVPFHLFFQLGNDKWRIQLICLKPLTRWSRTQPCLTWAEHCTAACGAGPMQGRLRKDGEGWGISCSDTREVAETTGPLYDFSDMTLPLWAVALGVLSSLHCCTFCYCQM